MYSNCIVCDQCKKHESFLPCVNILKKDIPKGWFTYTNPLFDSIDKSVNSLDPMTLSFEEYLIATDVFTFCSMECTAAFLKKAKELIAEHELKKKLTATPSQINVTLYVDHLEQH